MGVAFDQVQSPPMHADPHEHLRLHLRSCAQGYDDQDNLENPNSAAALTAQANAHMIHNEDDIHEIIQVNRRMVHDPSLRLPDNIFKNLSTDHKHVWMKMSPDQKKMFIANIPKPPRSSYRSEQTLPYQPPAEQENERNVNSTNTETSGEEQTTENNGNDFFPHPPESPSQVYFDRTVNKSTRQKPSRSKNIPHKNPPN